MNSLTSSPRAFRPAQANVRKRERFPWHVLPAIVIVYACMLPRELTFEVAGVAMQPFRAAMVLMLPMMITQAARHRVSFSVVDLFAFIAAAWFFIALSVTEPFERVMAAGLAEGLNFLLAYFTGRVCIRRASDFRTLVVSVFPGLAVCAVWMAIESITHTQVFRPMLGQMLGTSGSYPYEVRMGLMRSPGPFQHPIAASVFLSSFLPMVWYLSRTFWQRVLGAIGVGGFYFSLSSTGFLALGVGIALLITNALQRATRLPIFAGLAAAAIICFIGIEMLSEAGFFSFYVRRLTLGSGSGYYRMAIWTYAGADVMNHPIFGIGLREYIRPAWMGNPSVDAYWLLMTLRFGFPAMIAIAIVMLSGVVMALRGAYSPYELDRLVAYSIAFSLVAIIFTGFSVHHWEGMGVWMILLAGTGVTFGQIMRAQNQAARARPVMRGSRFRATPHLTNAAR